VLGWWIGSFVWSAVLDSSTFPSCVLYVEHANDINRLCGSLGLDYGNSKVVYQMAFNSWWNAWCFLVSSVLPSYEAVNKHPISELCNEPGDLWEAHPL